MLMGPLFNLSRASFLSAAVAITPLAGFVASFCPRHHTHTARIVATGPLPLTLPLSPSGRIARCFSSSFTVQRALNDNEIRDAKSLIEETIANTDRGRSLESAQERTHVHSLLSNLESLCPLSEPARDARMNGPWIVLYTDAPPPSNGQLGFFKGIAKQVIDLEARSYRNELYVGGHGADGDEGAWLTAVLDAKWKEWDGVYLDSAGDVGVIADEKDPGATTWKVDFESITLSLFRVPLFTQQFKAGTSRTWRMSYLDNDTRIVRAGKTGRGEDDWIFYMRRGN